MAARNVTTAKKEALEAFSLPSDAQTPITTNTGLAYADDCNSLRVGQRGPTLLEDHQLREKITHFDHERIPERAVHARGVRIHVFCAIRYGLYAVFSSPIVPWSASEFRHVKMDFAWIPLRL